MKWKPFAVGLGIFCLFALDGCVDSFSPTGESDPRAPTILSTLPEDGAVDVAVDAVIQVTFSEAIAPASVDRYAMWAVWEQTTVEGALSLSEDGLTVSFTPSTPLREGAQYGVNVSRRITDVDSIPLDIDGQDTQYRFSFTVGKTVPYVVSVTPAGDATGVAVDTAAVTVVFSEAMNPTTIDSDSIFVYDVDGVTTWDAETLTATFTLQQPLACNTRYTIGALKQITDQWGIPMEDDQRFTFTTETGLEDGDLDATDAADDETVEIAEITEESGDTGVETEDVAENEITVENEAAEDDAEPAAEDEAEAESPETGV